MNVLCPLFPETQWALMNKTAYKFSVPFPNVSCRRHSEVSEAITCEPQRLRLQSVPDFRVWALSCYPLLGQFALGLLALLQNVLWSNYLHSARGN